MYSLTYVSTHLCIHSPIIHSPHTSTPQRNTIHTFPLRHQSSHLPSTADTGHISIVNMRVSTLAAAFLAAGALASPINDKRALVDEITFTIVETIWVPAPAPTAPVAHVPDTTVLTPTTAPAVVVPQAVNDAAAAPVTTIIRDLQPTDPRYKALALVHHNVHRSNHSASSVVYNTTIESWAKAKAESCVWNEDL